MGDARSEEDWKPRASAAMDRYACGDDAAFAELYDLLAPRLHAFLCRRTRDEARAEDLLQQTFLQMHAARRHFTRGADVMPWAFAIARRLLIDGARRSAGRDSPARTDGDPAAVLDDRPSHEPSPASLASARHLLRRVEQELEHVAPSHRIAFELVRLDGISLDEAAQMLGTTVMAVKLRVHRALEALRERLGPEVREELGELA
jgi:RNA polymerase sigma-70 factor (ECF subfamily)